MRSITGYIMEAPDILLSFFGFASILDRFAHLYPKERQRTVLPFLFVGHRVRKPVQAASILPVSPADAVPRTRPLTASRGGIRSRTPKRAGRTNSTCSFSYTIENGSSTIFPSRCHHSIWARSSSGGRGDRSAGATSKTVRHPTRPLCFMRYTARAKATMAEAVNSGLESRRRL